MLLQQLGPYGSKLFVDYQNKDKAKKQFVSLFQEQLRNCDVQDWEIKSLYTPQVEKFVESRSLKVILDKAFESGFKGFDQIQITKMWGGQDRPKVPGEFDWNLMLKHYGEQVREIRRQDLDLRQILDSTISDDVASTLKSIGAISPGFNLKGYRKSLKDNYGSLKLNTSNSNSGDERIDLVEMFVEQYVREDLPLAEIQQADATSAESNSAPVLQVLAGEKSPHVAIVGDPGSGKSTLLRYLALAWTMNKRERFPIVIDIREYAKDKSPRNFLEFLERGASTGWKFDRQKLHDYLQSQPSLVMFDGLDEVFIGGSAPVGENKDAPSEQRRVYDSIVEEIINFGIQYPKAKIIVTSQVEGYHPERLQKANFRHFTLQKFDRGQIATFIDKWYDLVLVKDPEKDRLKQQIEASIENSPAIRKLAENPNRLTMVAISNRRKSSILGRTEFYEESLRELLHKWDIDRQNSHPELDSIGRVEKQAMLQLIAYEIQSTSSPTVHSIDGDRLKTILTGYLEQERFVAPSGKAGLIIQQLVARNLLSIVGDAAHTDDGKPKIYIFTDRNFLEYCYAKEIVGRFERRKSAEEFGKLQQDVFATHWQDRSWHQIIQSICGLLEPQWAGAAIEFLLDLKVERVDYLDREKRATSAAFLHLELAKECLAEIKNGRSITAIEHKLKEQLKNEIDGNFGIALSFEAATLLTHLLAQPLQGKVAGSDVLKWLEDRAFHARHKFVRAVAIQSIGEYCHTEKDTAKWLQDRAVTDRHELVRGAAIQSVGRYYHDRADTAQWLQERGTNDRHELVRREAVESVGRYYPLEPNTLKWLQDRAVGEQHESIRAAAVQSIGQYHREEPETLKWLQDRAVSDRHELVRGTAVRAVSQHYRSQAVFSWLKTSAQSGKYADIRAVAVQSLAKYYHTQPDTLKSLQDRALCDRHEDVRLAAVRAIPLYYRTRPDTLPWLKARVLHAKHQSVRVAAVQSIGACYHAQADTIPWLKSISDTYPNLQSAVVESIAKYDRQDPQTLTWLQGSIGPDRSPTARQTAVKSIGEYYHTQPEVLPWLRSIGLDETQDKSVRELAVQSIGEYDRHQPDTQAWLQTIALNNNQPEEVQSAAVQSIGLYYHPKPDTLAWLKSYALQQNEHKLVQQAAVDSFVKYDRSDDTLNWLKNRFQPQHKQAQQVAVDSISEYYYNEADTLSWLQERALDRDRHEDVRAATVQTIARHYYAEPEVQGWLRERAVGDRDPIVRFAAVQPVAKYYYMEPNTLTWLQERALDREQPEPIRAAAVQSIAKYYPNPDTLKWLKEIAIHDRDLVVRQSSIESIAEYYYTEPDTLKWLKSVALDTNKDRDKAEVSLQRSAVESIAKYSHNEPNTLTWLKSPAFDDPNKDIRASAVGAIATYYYTKPGTLKWLKARSIDDPELDVRTAAEREISKYYNPNFETLQSLQARALEDPEKAVRREAIESIAESYRKQPKTLNWLQEQALTCKHPDVRRGAIQSIAKYYQEDPDTLSWLQDRALHAEYPDVGAAAVESVAQNYRKLDWIQAVALDDAQPKEVKIAAVKSIAQHYRKDPDTLKWFQTQAFQPERDAYVRLGAVAAITKYYRKQPDTLKWFKNCAVKAHHPDVRAAAAVSIAKYYNSDPNTIAWLKDRALDAPPQLVLRAIVESIAKYYQHQSSSLVWLKNRAVHAPDRSLRGETILAVAKYYRQQPATYDWLKERVIKDKDGLVRGVSVESIAKYYHKDVHPLIWPKAAHEKISPENIQEASNRLEWLTASLKDPDGLVRASAVISLAKYYHMHPHAPAWLKNRAVEDPDGLIRAAAVKAVAKYYHKHDDILDWLKDRDLYDEHESVRVEILVSLSKYYHKDPATFSWLADHALDDQDPFVRSAAIRSLDRYFPISNEMYKLLRIVVDRDIDRDNYNEAYPKPLALKILVEKCGYSPQ
jgi:predicted NACHT family NTPase